MFPHIPLHTITVDLANTQSISHTVENILNGLVSPPPTSPLTTPLSTTSSSQVAASTRTAPVPATPTSAVVKSTDQEHTTTERESTELDTSGQKPLAPTTSSTDHVVRQDSGVGFSDSDSGLRKRVSATTSSSKLVGEPSSSQDACDVKTGCTGAAGPIPDGKKSTRYLTDDPLIDGEEHQPTLQEDSYLTLQQRKNNMLQAAKHRYLQNHPETSSFPPPSL